MVLGSLAFSHGSLPKIGLVQIYLFKVITIRIHFGNKNVVRSGGTIKIDLLFGDQILNLKWVNPDCNKIKLKYLGNELFFTSRFANFIGNIGPKQSLLVKIGKCLTSLVIGGTGAVTTGKIEFMVILGCLVVFNVTITSLKRRIE